MYADQFTHDYKNLKKAYPSLWDYDGDKGDFADLKKVLQQNPTDLRGVERVDQLGNTILLPVYKVKKFACKSLQSTTKLRIIYVYDKQSEIVQFIQFIEIYAKADKANENRDRIKKLLEGKESLSDLSRIDRTNAKSDSDDLIAKNSSFSFLIDEEEFYEDY